MPIKRLAILSGIWLLLVIGVGLWGVWRITTRPLEGISGEDRASQLGVGLGTLASLGLAALWLPALYRLGKQRRARPHIQNKKRRG